MTGSRARSGRATRRRTGSTVIVGEEIRTSDGDLIALFLERAVAPGGRPRETIEEVRAQGGLVGIPHPFDRFRGSMLKDPRLEAIGRLVDWVEAHNARIVGGAGNERAAAFAREHGPARRRGLRRPQRRSRSASPTGRSTATRPRPTGCWRR